MARNGKQLVEYVHAIFLLLSYRGWSAMTSGILTNLESYFVARVHVNSFMVAMKQPAVLHMVRREGWDSGPERVGTLATPVAVVPEALTDPFIAITTICRPRSPLRY